MERHASDDLLERDADDSGTGRRVGSGDSDSFLRLTERLAAASIRLRWEAHKDIPWDEPEMEVRRDDCLWEAPGWDPLGASAWYRDQAPDRRAGIGLHRTAVLFKAVIEFEAALQQGLLRYAAGLPNRHPAFRYIYHEISEEAQHTMMFQEFIDRSSFDPPPASPEDSSRYREIAALTEEQPALFFLGTLAGEESLDYLQRRLLSTGDLHPLMERITRIHCAEEARHVSFARAFLKESVPKLPPRERRLLSYQAPVVIDWIVGRAIDVPLADSASHWQIPSETVQDLVTGKEFHSIRRASASGVVKLCRSLGLLETHRESRWRSRGLI